MARLPLFLVRHGQTDWNLVQRFQSRTDIALNETGREQGRRIHSRLREDRIDFSVARCSPLERAVETAEIILAGSGLEAHADERLLEISLGDFEGEREADLRERLGAEFDSWRGLCFTEAAPNGETIFDAIERVSGLVEELSQRAVEENVLIVAHQGVNMALMAAISGRHDLESLADFRQRNDQVEVWDLARRSRRERFDV